MSCPPIRQRWRSVFLLLNVAFLLYLKVVWAVSDNFADLVIANEEESRSRIIMIDGNIYFHAGKNKNISFHVTNGASIMLGKTDVLQLPNQTETNAIRTQLQTSWTRLELLSRTTIFAQKTIHELMKRTKELNTQQGELSTKFQAFNETLKGRGRTNRKLKALIVRLSGQIERLLKLMRTNECEELAPCKNGGTCIDLFGKFQCICPDHFEGTQCESRVDECSMYNGTTAGCQNNATCTNNVNVTGFTCHCPPGFHGHLCQQNRSACEYSLDLCGEHGHCITNSDVNGIGYKCLCEWGYQLAGDPSNPICEDIDECRENPCYPGSSCLNLPGSFKCASCPRGTIGNGFHCIDFDECANDLTNDCSKNPRVDCINIHGSYKCGECPSGYRGDGFKCEQISPCAKEMNTCHPLAKCVEESAGTERRCDCPTGYVGDGIGAEGCVYSYESACRQDTCLNGGTCQSISNTEYRCNCAYGYWGEQCAHDSPCLTRNYCGPNGHCNANTLGCECNPGYYGTFCQYEQSCGFHTSNESGVIVFEKTASSSVLKWFTCTWYIQLFDTRKVIQFNVENITNPKLYEVTSKSCEASFVNFTMFDGPNAESPTIVNFCHGDNSLALQHPIYTSGNALTIRMTSRMQSQNTFLKLNWTSVRTRCGGRLTANEGRIDYYDVHDEDACVWYVRVEPQYHIELSVETLKMASGELMNCSVNSLEVYDSQVARNRTRIVQICDTQSGVRPVIRTSGNVAVVYFRLDTSRLSGDKCAKCGIGFSLRYKTISLPDGCGGEIQLGVGGDDSSDGFIQSPNYGHVYFPNLDCLWVLNATSAFGGGVTINAGNGTSALASDSQLVAALMVDRKIAVEFLEFDVATTVTQYATYLLATPWTFTNCRGDYVSIVEKNFVYCNNQPPLLMTPIVHAPTLSIKFHTDASVGGKGFMLKYGLLCQRDFTAPNGTISSPNYPKPSARPFKCTYRIVAEPHQAIRVQFNWIGLHTDIATCFYRKSMHNEIKDYIELSGGYSSYEAINKRYVCARFPFIAPGGEIVTSGMRPFEIIYSTSGSRNNTGFSFRYEIMDVGCGGVFNADEPKTITSPNYPQSYMAHMYCIYHLSVPEKKGLRLTFDVFNVENVANRDDCEFDSVRVYDWFVDEKTHGDMLGRFCGISLPPPLLSTTGRMVVVFVSDRSVSGAGFAAKFQAVDVSQDCDRTFIAPSGVINFSPAMFQKAQTIKCDYFIVLPTNHRILLKVENFSAPCDYSTLMIKNGASEESPGFPGLYRNSEICDGFPVVRLKSQGNRLFLRFQSLNLESYFTVRYEQYEAGCGGHILGFSGAISAPQYPQKDSRSLNCEWHVAVALGNKVRLQFTEIDDLNSEDSYGMCSPYGRNLISIGEGSTLAETVLKRYCKKELAPLPVDSVAGNQLTIQYIQHGGSHHGAIFGFLARFTTVCTGLILTDYHGTIESPGYPLRVHESRNCHWQIRTTPGSRIRLLFHRFRVHNPSPFGSSAAIGFAAAVPRADRARGAHNRCRHNFLWVDPSRVQSVDGTSLGLPINFTRSRGVDPDSAALLRVAYYCNEFSEPTEITTVSNTIDIQFSSREEPENHFWLTWITIGCGGMVSRNGSQLLVNASSDFADDDATIIRECAWRVSAPVGNVIRVHVNEMYAPSAADDTSDSDGVEFYTGTSNASGMPYKRLRGTVRDVEFLSFTNEIYVRFRSNATTAKHTYHNEFARDGVVFRACVNFITPNNTNGGSVIKLDPDSKVTVHSTNYPQAPPVGSEAIWQFEAPEGFVVAMNLLRFATQNVYRAHSVTHSILNANLSFSSFYRCNMAWVSLQGGISFFNGPYNPDFRKSNPNPIRHICDTLTTPTPIVSKTNVSYILFRAPKSEPTLASGDAAPMQTQSGGAASAVASSGGDPSTQPAMGFLLEARARCGGQLYAASGERKSFIVSRMDASVTRCEWEIVRQVRASVKRNFDAIAEVDEEAEDDLSADEESGGGALSSKWAGDDDSRRVYLRIEKINRVTSEQYPFLLRLRDNRESELEVFCGDKSLGVYNDGSITYSPEHFLEFSCEQESFRLVVSKLGRFDEFLVSYDVESSFCGGNLNDAHGRISMMLRPEAATSRDKIECEWLLTNIPGSLVKLQILSLSLPTSDYCAESFLELRRDNASGPLVQRFCTAADPATIYEGQAFYLRLRYLFNTDRERAARLTATLSSGAPADGVGGDDDIVLPNESGLSSAALLVGHFNVKYTKSFGGTTSSPIIESPPPHPVKPAADERDYPWMAQNKYTWKIAATNSTNVLRVEFIEYSFIGLVLIYDLECDEVTFSQEHYCPLFVDRAIIVKNRLDEGQRVFDIDSNRASIVSDHNSQFKVRWSEMEKRQPLPDSGLAPTGGSAPTGVADNVFICGEDLIADFRPKTLRKPSDPASGGRYSNNERCRWRIKRPQFSGIVINLTSIELEEHVNCRYDFLAMTTKSLTTVSELEEVPEWMRVCRKEQRGNKIAFNYDNEMFIYFYSDRSRVFPGFSLDYYLSCNTFEYFPVYKGVLDAVLTNPFHPSGYRRNESCFWGIMVESNRNLQVESLELDIAERDPVTQLCESDALEFSDRPYFEASTKRVTTFCGRERVNLTMQNGRVFVKFRTRDASTTRRGFKLRLTEVIHDCSVGDMALSELDALRTISSPNFPHLSPNSLDCQWTLSAPAGRRLKFTVDPATFNLQSTDDEECVEDFLEIRDGASAYSPLIGRYCGLNSPGTIFSSGSHLHLHYVTDSITQSLGWNATFELESCGGVIALREGRNASITSPNFPDMFSPKADCQWTVRAPAGHFVEAFIDHIWMPVLDNCTSDYLEIRDINATGDYLQSPLCSKAAVVPGGYRSSHNTLYVRYETSNTFGRMNRFFCMNHKCGVKMHFTSSKFACGGLVNDDEGRVFPPGYPHRLIPHVFCQWDFRAGINYRYVLQLEFLSGGDEEDALKDLYERSTSNSHLLESDDYCFVDLEVWNGGVENQHVQYPMFRRFCANATTFVSAADMVTLMYNDLAQEYAYDATYYAGGNRSALYQPFHVTYKRVSQQFDRDNNGSSGGCAYEVTGPRRIEIKDMRFEYGGADGGGALTAASRRLIVRSERSFCHIQVRKPAENATVRLEFTDFRGGRQGSRHCTPAENQVLIRDDRSDPYPIERALCNGSLHSQNNVSLAYVNAQVDIFVLNNPYSLVPSLDSTVGFNLSVSFSECGGVIDEGGGMSGEITSPHFGPSTNYTDDTDCLWYLRAPEGKVISLEITFMDIEYHIECINDYLEVSEGEDRLAVIHRYCNEKMNDNELQERFRRLRSRSRALTLLFHSDASISRRGFRLEYEFVGYEENACGFHSHALSGVIHSPRYGTGDYPPNLSCIWDLIVSSGFHIRLTFEFFDLEISDTCRKDYLQVSQEHQSRAMAPVGSYYFYFDHEETMRTVCGNELPPPVESESNRLRLNFSTDATISGKGFRLRWDSVCGTLFKMNHGVITSPHYPNFYPNENTVCEYLIDPETNGAPKIVTLKVLDVDLDNSHVAMRKECVSDYLEIRDVFRDAVLLTVCGATFQGSASPAISIKGQSLVRFVSNTSMFHGTRKYHRGFKISYALADCGGEINLADARNRMSAVISSPGFPLPYHHSLNCLWSVIAPEGRIISYKFTHLDMELSNECVFDYLEIVDGSADEWNATTDAQRNVTAAAAAYGGHDKNSSMTARRFCGNVAPEGQQRTTSNTLLLRFVTDQSSNKDGFRIVVTATLGPSQGCGGTLTVGDEWRTLAPPLDPLTGKYYADLRCDWTLKTADALKLIELRFTMVEMEQKRPAASADGGAVDDASASLFPSSDDGAAGNATTSKFVNNCYDFVAVYDGPKAISTYLLEPTCAVPSDLQLPLSYYSSYRTVDVYFETDSYDEFRGFSVDYRAIEADCGGTYQATEEWTELRYESERTLTRSNQRQKRCRFFIYSPERQPVEIKFIEFSFPSRTADCVDEFLELRDVGSVAECEHPACTVDQRVSAGSTRSCGAAAPPLFVSGTSIVQISTSVVLQSQYSAKFVLKYQLLSACNRTVDASSPLLQSGRITSPNYPNPYLHNTTCTTYLSGQRTGRLFLVFGDFKLERSRYRIPFLRYDRQWYADAFNRGVVFGRKSAAAPVDSLNGTAAITTATSAAVASSTPSAATVAAANTLNCAYDALSIYYNSSDPTQNVTMCGFGLPESLLSAQNQVTLSLKTDVSMAYSGYELFYYTVTSRVVAKGTGNQRIFELGETHEIRGSLTHLPNMKQSADDGRTDATDGGTYIPNALQRVTIVPPRGMECNVEFRKVELSNEPDAYDCGKRDRLVLTRTAYDTSLRSPPALTKINSFELPCKTPVSQKLPIPAGYAMLIEFYTDNDPSNDGAGFRIEWTCEPFRTPLH